MYLPGILLLFATRKPLIGVPRNHLRDENVIKPWNDRMVTSHLLYLDGLRAICALYVLIHHALIQSKVQSGIAFRVLNTIFQYGHFAVDIFIVLSGFCLMLPVIKNNGCLKNSVQDFIRKRVRRILPTYYLAMALSLLLIYTLIGEKAGTHWDVSIPVHAGDIVAHVFLLQDIFGGTSARINHSLWSIAVEWRIYFIFPILIVSFKRWGGGITSLFILVLSIGIWGFLKYFTHFNASPWGINPHYLGLFALGMFSANVSNSKVYKFSSIIKPGVLLGIAILLLAFACYIYDYKWGLWLMADIAIGIGCSCLLIAASSGKVRGLTAALSWKPLAFIGTFAYSIYLVHAPLLEVFSRYALNKFQLNNDLHIILLISIGGSLTLALSYLFFLFAEKPFLTKKFVPTIRDKPGEAPQTEHLTATVTQFLRRLTLNSTSTTKLTIPGDQTGR